MIDKRFSPVARMMGIGPMRIIPPELAKPFESMEAIVIKRAPMMIKLMPRRKSLRAMGEKLFSGLFVIFCASYYELLSRSKNAIMSAITMIVKMSRIFTDSLSVPMMMGKGPISMMPAPFALGFVLVIEMVIERKMTAIPAMMKMMPISAREVQSGNCVRHVKHEKPNN